jgi:lanthanide-dependent methanol dehydrogenase
MLASRTSSVLAITLLIASVPGVHDVATAQPAAGAEWTTPAGTVQGTRFSSLDQINSGNVSQLEEEFRFSTGVLAGHEGQPLVVNGVMYVVSPFPNKLFALDLARGGDVRWVFDPKPDPFARDKACCDIVNRGAAFHPRDPNVSTSVDKVIFTVLDNTTVAVDARTGREVWRTKLGDPAIGQTMTMAPLVIRNKVFVGNSGGEMGVRGFIAGLDAETGKEVWRGWSTGPDSDVLIVPGVTRPPYPQDQGVNLGVTTWPGTLWQQGGSTVWLWITYDPEFNLVFHGTANPGVWNPDMRPGDNKWSTTMFARDPDTGVVRYMYQMTPHDAWDYDGTNENIVADVGGRKLVVRFDRNGFAYAHERATGRILNANPYVKVNWADGIDIAVTGSPIENPAKRTHEGVTVSDICPALVGGKDQQPAAFSPRTELFYVPASTLCMNYHALKAIYIAGTPFVGASAGMFPAGFPEPDRVEKRGFGPPVAFPVPCGRPGVTCGEFIAWDAATGTKKWGIKEPFPVWSGVLATAGDLVFYGTLDRWFKAVDARTGEVVFQTQLDSGIVGNPITFLGPDGQQRIAIWSGPGGAMAKFIPHDLLEDDPNPLVKLPQFTGPGHVLHVFKIGS